MRQCNSSLLPQPTNLHSYPSLNPHMSNTRTTSTSSSNFQLKFNNALKAYERRTKNDHPLAAQDLRRWLSPPDPSTNHNIASNAHHEGTATWFFRGSIYQGWKSTTSEPLLWVYGKRAPLSHTCLTRELPDKILYV